jgi:KDO2-lipid IV(A) lauroyltransferase
MKQARPLGENTIRFALFLVRMTPRRLGYWLAKVLGRLYGRLQHEYRAIVESNLRAVLGTDDPRKLHRVALEVFATAARSYYELLYMPFSSREEILSRVEYEEPGWSQFQEAYSQQKGVILTGAHLSSFDMVGQAVLAQGFHIFAIALPDQADGFIFMNKMRAFQQRAVIQATGPAALRHALRVLRDGGVIATGADRPVKGQGTVVEFFGRPTLLPDGPVRLALRTGAAFLLAICYREGDKYHLRFCPIELVSTGDDETDVQAGVQRVAQAMEPAIRARPEQWHLLIQLWE